jgi:hypothetical protein
VLKQQMQDIQDRINEVSRKAGGGIVAYPTKLIEDYKKLQTQLIGLNQQYNLPEQTDIPYLYNTKGNRLA